MSGAGGDTLQTTLLQLPPLMNAVARGKTWSALKSANFKVRAEALKAVWTSLSQAGPNENTSNDKAFSLTIIDRASYREDGANTTSLICLMGGDCI